MTARTFERWAPFQGWLQLPSVWSTAVFAVGWSAGWFLLWSPRRLPRAAPADTRPSMAVIVPARNEGHVIGSLVAAMVAQAGRDDQVVVVDDQSTDGTAALAEQHGARVVAAGELPPGWAGKPHACHVGAAMTTADVLLFVDADVTPEPHLLNDVCAAVAASPRSLVSVQPWHRPGRGLAHGFEQLSVIFNLVALMGCGAFTPLGPQHAGRVAFGPVLACRRSNYEAIGGHATVDVRGAILEDIALARRFDRREIFVGSSTGTSFRMYPGGRRAVVEGWTKGIAIGADAASWWATLGTAAWVASVAGGWLVSVWLAALTVLQLLVLARRAGRFALWAIVLFPVPTALFVVVVVRSLIARRLRREVSWRDRRLRPDQETG